MEELLRRGRRPLWSMCESPLTNLYRRYGFVEVSAPERLPPYFQVGYWALRVTIGMALASRGTYVANMVLD